MASGKIYLKTRFSAVAGDPPEKSASNPAFFVFGDFKRLFLESLLEKPCSRLTRQARI
jgi:hypothetical protein